MNSKMTTNSQLSTTELERNKNKLSKQLDRNGITEMEITWRLISERRRGENGEKVQGIRSINGK